MDWLIHCAARHEPYSGCGGNANRFETYEKCAYTCSLFDGPGAPCTHAGRTYAHREPVVREVGELSGCAPCLCNDGQLLCPPDDCECPAPGAPARPLRESAESALNAKP